MSERSSQLDAYQRGFVTVQYLLRADKTELGGSRCDPPTPSLERTRAGLLDPDRNVRAKWLARGLRELAAALDDRRFDAA